MAKVIANQNSIIISYIMPLIYILIIFRWHMNPRYWTAMAYEVEQKLFNYKILKTSIEKVVHLLC